MRYSNSPAGEGACARPDRTRLGDYPLAPDTPPVTCAAAAALELWRIKTLAPAAQEIFGTGIARIEHLGAFSCRRTYGTTDGPWSEHATANAIDVEVIDFPAFVKALLKKHKKIAFLKMDIEGAELDVLEAMETQGLFDKITLTVAETHEKKFKHLRPRFAALRATVGAKYPITKVNLDWI